MRIKQILWVLAAFLFSGVVYAQRGGMPSTSAQPQPAPMPGQQSEQQMGNVIRGPAGQKGQTAKGPSGMSLKEVTKEIKNSPPETVIKDVQEHGVNFDMTPDIEKKLRKVKATDQVIEAVRLAGPKVRAQMAKMVLGPGPGGVKQIPREQAQAFDAIRGELDPDKDIALADDFAKKYPDSDLLSYVYSFAANAYQQKGNAEKIAEYTDKSLKLKPDNLMSLILRVEVLPLPQYLNNHEVDRDKILAEVVSECDRALKLIPQVPKQANETEADYQKRLADIGSQVHGSLGMVHLEQATETLSGPDKAELAKSEQEFNVAVAAANHPAPQDYFRLGEAYSMDGKLDDAIQAFTKAGQLGQGTMIKAYSDQQIAELQKRKAQGSVAPSPK